MASFSWRGDAVRARASNGSEVESQGAKNYGFGRFKLNERLKVDHVDLAFVNGLETTYGLMGSKKVHLLRPFPSLEYQQCTVNISVVPNDMSMEPALHVIPWKGHLEYA